MGKPVMTITLAKIEMDGQTWHVYRRGVGGPLALSVNAWGGGNLSIETPPYLLAAIGTMFLNCADKASSGRG